MFRNTFLRSLSAGDLTALGPRLQEVTLGAGQQLCKPGEPPEFVYFPSSAVVSVVTILRDGREFEVSSIGFEGVANLFPALTDIPDQTRTFVQVAGAGFRLPAAALRQQLDASPDLLRRVLEYLQISAAQSQRSIACNAVHPLSGRLARWLLITNDRVDVPVMALTQDYMCVMAAALRSSISLTASAFKRDGLITYKRGQVAIVDRPGLERRACECYRDDQRDLGRLVVQP